MDNISTRLTKLLDSLNITKTAFAKEIGLSQPFVSNLCAGATKPSDRTIADICRIFRVSEQWLRTGEGPMYVEQSRAEKIAAFLSDVMADTPESIRSVVVSCLADFDADDWQAIDRIYRKYLDSKNDPCP